MPESTSDILIQTNALQDIASVFLGAAGKLQDKILKRILELLDSYDSKGGFFETSTTNRAKLAAIEGEITSIIKAAGYFSAADLFIRDLGKITENTIKLQAGFNSIELQKKSLVGIQKVYAENAITHLSEGGLNSNFIGPVTTIVNEATTFGYSIEKSRQTLQEFVTGTADAPGKLESYLTTTARDTVSQLQGAQHQAISNEFEMPLIRYVGGELKDSRGQCVRWHGMQYIQQKDLQKEIDLAFKNQAAKLIMPKGHRWGGMIKDTTPENFLIRRGGWGCLHTAIPVRKKA